MGSARLRIVIPGGTGHLGRTLTGYFSGRGDRVTVLTRNVRRAGTAAQAPGSEKDPVPWRTLPWDGETLGEWTEALEGADVWRDEA